MWPSCSIRQFPVKTRYLNGGKHFKIKTTKHIYNLAFFTYILNNRKKTKYNWFTMIKIKEWTHFPGWKLKCLPSPSYCSVALHCKKQKQQKQFLCVEIIVKKTAKNVRAFVPTRQWVVGLHANFKLLTFTFEIYFCLDI